MKNKKHRQSGFSLIEIAVTILVLMIAFMASSQSTLNTVKGALAADHNQDAVNIASFLCETWRGLDGSETFDPKATFGYRLQMHEFVSNQQVPAGYTRSSQVEFVYNGNSYFATLAWKDQSADLRSIFVRVCWNRYAIGRYSIDQADKEYTLEISVVR